MKILIVDDSALVRSILKNVIATSRPAWQIVGEASNGVDAIRLNALLCPDLVICDIEMPLMNGMDAITGMMASRPVTIVILTGAASAETGFEALGRGAAEVIRKPALVEFNDPRFLDSFFEKIDAALLARSPDNSASGQPGPGSFTASDVQFRLVVIGASTGGPSALVKILTALPAEFPVPIALVQHLESGFGTGFASWLDEQSPLAIRIARDGEKPEPGQVLIAPDNRHLVIEHGLCVLDNGTPLRNQKPAVDMLFNSAALEYGTRLVGVLLTGMGRDGAEGCRTIVDRGGMTLVQDQATSAVFGMPRAAIEDRAASSILPLDRIATTLRSLTGCP